MFPELRRRRKISTIIFQQDGAPPHYSNQVRNYLRSVLPENRIIARGLGQPWPPRSPDLTPMDYWFWGMLKARIYHSFKPQNLDDLQQRIQDEIDNISVDELSSAVGNIRHRIDLVREVNGGTFAHLT